MSIKTQVLSLLFSLAYGGFFSFIYHINYKYIYGQKRIYAITITFLVVFNGALLYYLILRQINYGILHPYFLLMLIMGFYLGKKIIK